MENIFEDIKREYVNRYSETGVILLARNYEEFVLKMVACIRISLDDVKYLLPELTDEQRTEYIKILFFVVLDECPQLKHELAVHMYNELRKG